MMAQTHDPLYDTPPMRSLKMRNYKETLELYERLLAEVEVGTDPELRLEMVHAYFQAGILRSYLGRLTEAKETLRRGIDLAQELVAEDPDSQDYRWALAFCRRAYDDCLAADGYPLEERAREARATLELWFGLAREFPENTLFQHDLAGCRRELASCLWDAGRRAEAEQLARQALAAHQKLATAFSDFGSLSAVVADWCCLGSYLH